MIKACMGASGNARGGVLFAMRTGLSLSGPYSYSRDLA